MHLTLNANKIENDLVQLKGDVKKFVAHVKRHNVEYALGTVFACGTVVGVVLTRKHYAELVKAAQELSDIDIDSVKFAAVDEWIETNLANGLLTVVMDEKKHGLYLGALVNGGLCSQEQAADSLSMGADAIRWAKDMAQFKYNR